MKFDYGTQLNPSPIKLSMGTLIKPTLQQIYELTFEKFNYYEVLIKMTPETFYTKIKGNNGIEYWGSLSEEEKDKLTLYDIIVNDESLTGTFVEIFNFFFKETVIFKEGYFVLLNKGIDVDTDIISRDNIRGVISEDTLPKVLKLIQQVCCIYDDDDNVVDDAKFKNALAKKLYEKMQKGAKNKKTEKKASIDFTIPNIISSVSNKHPTISPLNVWNLTIFQLLDSFNRMQTNSMYDIDSTRVSMWGDEKKTFDASLWYKNEYDKK
jgi:hypothetical protein